MTKLYDFELSAHLCFTLKAPNEAAARKQAKAICAWAKDNLGIGMILHPGSTTFVESTSPYENLHLEFEDIADLVDTEDNDDPKAEEAEA